MGTVMVRLWTWVPLSSALSTSTLCWAERTRTCPTMGLAGMILALPAHAFWSAAVGASETSRLFAPDCRGAGIVTSMTMVLATRPR